MQLLLQKVEAEKVVKMIDTRLRSVESEYRIAKGGGDSKKAGISAQVKWELGELKMQFLDILLEQIVEDPQLLITNNQSIFQDIFNEKDEQIDRLEKLLEEATQ